jgi:DNA-directed RNA polymerase sigma subunit (sigma70/sigma32)
MTMTLKEAKIILDEFNSNKEKWSVLNDLIDSGVLENREYKLDEIAYLLGITKQAIKGIEQQALRKLMKIALEKGLYYESK